MVGALWIFSFFCEQFQILVLGSSKIAYPDKALLYVINTNIYSAIVSDVRLYAAYIDNFKNFFSTEYITVQKKLTAYRTNTQFPWMQIL